MRVVIGSDVTMKKVGNRFFAQQKYATIYHRYFEAFGQLSLVSRCEKTDTVLNNEIDVTGIIRDFVEMDSLKSLLLGKYNSAIRDFLKGADLAICRCPSFSSIVISHICRNNGIPYLAESMGCAWDAYWNHGLVGKVLAPYMFFSMKKVVYHADYAVYVTKEFLQNRYPNSKYSISASNVLLSSCDDAILIKRLDRIQHMKKNSLSFITTAAVDVKYKGQQYMIKAIPKLKKMGYEIDYYLIGEGDPSYLQKLAKRLHVSNNVHFLGRKPLNMVFEQIDECDFYIQPSLQEGLPRSMIEAMSRGCICLGAHTAGIPELIDIDCIFKRKSTSDIIKTIDQLLQKDLCLYAMRNFANSKDYLANRLDSIRCEFFAKIRNKVEGNCKDDRCIIERK